MSNLTQMEQGYKCLRAVYSTVGTYFLHKNVLIRRFICSEIKTMGLPKLNNISFAFNIFVPILVQEIFIQRLSKNHTNGHFSVGNQRSKYVFENLGGGLTPLTPPLDPPKKHEYNLPQITKQWENIAHMQSPYYETSQYQIFL